MSDREMPALDDRSHLDKARQYTDEANNFYTQKDYKSAIRLYHSCLLHARAVSWLFESGVQGLAAHFDRQLQADVSMGAAIDTTSSSTTTNGTERSRIKSTSRGEEMKEEANDVIKNAYYSLAACILNGEGLGPKDYLRAVDYCDKVLALDTGNKKALYRKGICLAKAGQYEKAIDVLRQCTATNLGAKGAVDRCKQALENCTEALATESESELSDSARVMVCDLPKSPGKDIVKELGSNADDVADPDDTAVVGRLSAGADAEATTWRPVILKRENADKQSLRFTINKVHHVREVSDKGVVDPKRVGETARKSAYKHACELLASPERTYAMLGVLWRKAIGKPLVPGAFLEVDILTKDKLDIDDDDEEKKKKKKTIKRSRLRYELYFQITEYDSFGFEVKQHGRRISFILWTGGTPVEYPSVPDHNNTLYRQA